MKNRQEALEYLEKLEGRLETLEAQDKPGNVLEIEALKKRIAELEKKVEDKPKGILDNVADFIFGKEKPEEG